MSTLQQVLWWIALPLQVWLLWQIVQVRAFKVYPCFLTYTLFSVIATSLRYLVHNNEDNYFYIYWATEAIYAVLGIAVIYEVYQHVFRNLLHLRGFRTVFPLVVLVTLALTISRAGVPVANETWIMQMILASEMGVRMLQVAMFLVLTGMTRLLGLYWRQHDFGISAGFGLYATFALFASTKFSEIGTTFSFWWSVLSVLSYNVAVLIWLWYFSIPVKTETSRSEEPPLSLQDLERYRSIARKVHRP
jgi:hypothetical protein